MYDTWDLVFRSMANEKRAGKCHTHIYKSILTPEKLLHYCYMNKKVINGIRICPTYDEAEAMLEFMAGLGYELQYDMADGLLYRYDWNCENEFQDREKYSLQEAALFCRDIAKELLESESDDEEEVAELMRVSELFNTWCERFTKVKKIYTLKG